ncbi:MAG: proline--tRNA ligase [Tissierellia bacterium]|nr:proline--tRNA ligase [Tissierellia bacterium]
MSKNKDNFVKEITKMEDDFAQWYTDIITKADLVDYSPVKGFMVIKSNGYALWESIQSFADQKFKETGHTNCYFPLLIPESLLDKEADHVEGFAPEVAWVTEAGGEELAERLAIRPTSETIICSMYKKWLRSYRDLPYLYNQWCSVVRWEKSTRPFLRTSEFLWQEGHTLHETKKEAEEETLQMLEIYRQVAEDLMAMPVVCGKKSEREKFAGAVDTYTMEALMHDGKALQAGTSHYLGQHFSTAFDITYQDRDGGLSHPHQTSWGISTRLIGGLIMVHSDNRGLVLPPKMATKQVRIIPIQQHKEGVMDKVNEIYAQLKKTLKVDIDDTDKTPGYKFNEAEMLGIPVRVEIGPRDIANNQAVLVRRDTFEKEQVSLDKLEDRLHELMDEIQKNLFDRAKARNEERTSTAHNMDEFKKALEEKPGFVRAMHCGDPDCELEIKDETSATLRCFPFDDNERIADTCINCGKKAAGLAYFAKAY